LPETATVHCPAARLRAATGAVLALVRVSGSYPVLVPVTCTATVRPTSPTIGVYDVPVAPGTAVPATVHW